MFEIVQAPSEIKSDDGIKLFIAGGISNCPQWQDQLIKKLINDSRLIYPNKKIILINPRCEDCPLEEPQTKWEYKKLRKSDIIIFWFSIGSLNPIALFEYGSYIKSRSKKIIVGCDPDYLRKNAVIIQTKLVHPKFKVNENFDDFYNEIVETLINKFKI